VQRQYVHVHGRTIAYFDSAPGDRAARVLVLVHAFPLGAGMWEGQAKALPAGWRLIAPDMRGFGGSSLPNPDTTPTIDDYADDVTDVLRELGIQAPVIGGLSMGGYITFAVLRRHPSLARAVVLADTRASADTLEGRANRRSMLAIVEREGPSGVARDMMPKLLGRTSRDTRPDVEPLVRRLIKQQSPHAIRAAILRMMDRPDSFATLQTVTVPTLVVAGEEDTLTPVDDSRKMHAALANAELVIIPAAGHLANLEAPGAFNSALSGFLARV
jgi:pimeloyl-ACP methyl ester carboxylesterase